MSAIISSFPRRYFTVIGTFEFSESSFAVLQGGVFSGSFRGGCGRSQPLHPVAQICSHGTRCSQKLHFFTDLGIGTEPSSRTNDCCRQQISLSCRDFLQWCFFPLGFQKSTRQLRFPRVNDDMTENTSNTLSRITQLFDVDR